MTSNVLCRYYAAGACAFGDKCRFSHNKEDEPSQVCKYYLAGNCAYGDKCRYQHSKPGWSSRGQPAPQSNYSAPSGVPKPATGGQSGGSMVKLPSGASEFGFVEGAPNWDDFMTPDEMDEFEQWQAEQALAAAGHGSRQHSASYGEDDGDIMDPADIPLCEEYAATGQCSAGDDCCYVHGEQCEVCERFVLHPYNTTEAQTHRDDCSETAAKLAKRVRDSAVECGICLEKVLSKRDMSQRRFGLMACEHSFCLSCIRNWRATGEVDAKTALRTCPICRNPTHFITPSTTWPDTPADKAAIIDAYKASMAEKDCAHFDFGDGTCPFGTSCFYRHAYRDGRLEEVHLRRAGDADGAVKVIAPVTLSSFLEASLTAQLALSNRRGRGRQQQQQPQQQRQQQQEEEEEGQHEQQHSRQGRSEPQGATRLPAENSSHSEQHQQQQQGSARDLLPEVLDC